MQEVEKNDINHKEIVDTFSKYLDEFSQQFEFLRAKVNGLSLNNKNKEEIESEMNDLNEEMGDYMDEFLKILKKTDIPKQWVIDDNKLYKSHGVDEVYGFNELQSGNEILENSVYDVCEEGMCAKVAFLSNLCCHAIEKHGITQMVEKIRVGESDVENIRGKLLKKKLKLIMKQFIKKKKEKKII